jgi:hypothetical protein
MERVAMMKWFDIQWIDTTGSKHYTLQDGENKMDAKEKFLARVEGFARNCATFKCFDFIAPNGPLPLTPGCCLG